MEASIWRIAAFEYRFSGIALCLKIALFENGFVQSNELYVANSERRILTTIDAVRMES